MLQIEEGRRTGDDAQKITHFYGIDICFKNHNRIFSEWNSDNASICIYTHIFHQMIDA